MRVSPVTPEWVRHLITRLRRHMVLKALGTTVFMSLFFVGYFHILRNPIFVVTQMPLTMLDRIVSFYPPALIAYASLWFYVGIPPALLLSLRELIVYGFWIGGLCSAGLLCFLLWPTAVPAQVLDAGNYPGFQILAGVDAKANACPSLHVATAVFSALWIDHLLRAMGARFVPRLVNWIWFVAIAYSTLAIKQHVALDALGGLLLGIPIGLLSLRGHRALGERLPASLPLELGGSGVP